jgi:hypothetical protein
MAEAFFDDQLCAAPPSEKEKALRDLFVSEYMKDFDAFQSALRCGFLPTFALEWGKKLFQEPYVQQQIAFLTRKPADNDAAQDAQDRALVENTLREAMQKGPYGARATATRIFMEYKGWAKPDANADAEQSLIDVMKGFAQRAPV